MKITKRQLRALIQESLDAHPEGLELRNVVASGLLLRLQKHLEGRMGRTLSDELSEIAAANVDRINPPSTADEMKTQASDVVRRILGSKTLESDLKDIVLDVFNSFDQKRKGNLR